MGVVEKKQIIDASAFPLLSLIRSAVSAKALVLVNTPGICLPEYVREEIIATTPHDENLSFEVKVNPALDSGVRVYRLSEKYLAVLVAVVIRKSYRRVKAVCLRVLSMARLEGIGLNKTDTSASGLTRDGAFSNCADDRQDVGSMDPHPSFGRRLGMAWSKLIAWCRERLDVHCGIRSVNAGSKLSAYVLVNSIEHLKALAFPAGLHVALTTYCDLKCIMCPYHAEDLRKQHTTAYFEDGKRMPSELLMKVIEEAGRAGANLGFGQYDEPFMYKGFADYAALAKEKGCTVSITTNGTQLTEERAHTLIKAGVEHISFSLDAASEETYRKIRLSDFSIPLENLKTLVRVRNKLQGKTVIRACLVVQNGNEHEQDLFRDRMKTLGLDMVSFYVLSRLENGVWKNARLNFDIEVPQPGERYACSQLWSQVAVYPDGNVALCCATTMYVGYRDDVPYVGNVKDNSLQDIWLSANYRKIRAEALAGVFGNSVCRDCEIWHNFQNRESKDEFGHLVHQNPYETFVHFR